MAEALKAAVQAEMKGQQAAMDADMLKELEQLRREKVERERQDLGIAEGKLMCTTPGCDYGERPADFRKIVAERRDPDTGMLENSMVTWANEDPHVCPTCDYALTVIPPDAVSAFPVGYRFQYPEPIR
jgi:hypothetical protein